jgi:hypothetical protein
MIHTRLPSSHHTKLNMFLTVTLWRLFRHNGSRCQVSVGRKLLINVGVWCKPKGATYGVQLFRNRLGSTLTTRLLWLLGRPCLAPCYFRSVLPLPKHLVDKCFQRTPTSSKLSPLCPGTWHRNCLPLDTCYCTNTYMSMITASYLPCTRLIRNKVFGNWILVTLF